MQADATPTLPTYVLDSLHSTAGYHHAGTYHHVPPPPQKSYANVVPLSLLNRWPATVECPACKEMTHTGTRYEVGKGTQYVR
jgi:hypothetical protein